MILNKCTVVALQNDVNENGEMCSNPAKLFKSLKVFYKDMKIIIRA